MSSYNAVNGVPSTASKYLLQDLLRDDWGFEGFVVGDCGAVDAIANGHHWAKTNEEGVAAGLINGTSMDCGIAYQRYGQSSLDKGFITSKIYFTLFDIF
jgi:beta-glucosidase-like glycosyl hydrolase